MMAYCTHPDHGAATRLPAWFLTDRLAKYCPAHRQPEKLRLRFVAGQWRPVSTSDGRS
jgi:hypothetical protein